jgi:hypothetical protein
MMWIIIRYFVYELYGENRYIYIFKWIMWYQISTDIVNLDDISIMFVIEISIWYQSG